MSQNAVIRVKLDTAGAKSDLQSLYAEMRRSPGIQTGGGMGGAGGLRSSGGGGGGFSLASLLPGLLAAAPLAMLGAPVVRDAGTIANTVLGGAGGALSSFLGVGGLADAASGRKRAIEETAQAFGLARGLGLISREESDSFYETIRPFREAQANGTGEIQRELGWENAKTTFEETGTKIVAAIEKLGDKIGGGR